MILSDQITPPKLGEFITGLLVHGHKAPFLHRGLYPQAYKSFVLGVKGPARIEPIGLLVFQETKKGCYILRLVHEINIALVIETVNQ